MLRRGCFAAAQQILLKTAPLQREMFRNTPPYLTQGGARREELQKHAPELSVQPLRCPAKDRDAARVSPARLQEGMRSGKDTAGSTSRRGQRVFEAGISQSARVPYERLSWGLDKSLHLGLKHG